MLNMLTVPQNYKKVNDPGNRPKNKTSRSAAKPVLIKMPDDWFRFPSASGIFQS
jgi:hypothetical protein